MTRRPLIRARGIERSYKLGDRRLEILPRHRPRSAARRAPVPNGLSGTGKSTPCSPSYLPDCLTAGTVEIEGKTAGASTSPRLVPQTTAWATSSSSTTCSPS
ncbi:MAG: hypothetical protein R3F17_15115 [Planctomycetota bacterium]